MQDVVREHKAGNPVGIYAVCSAHPLVLEAAVEKARVDGSALLVEATSNQVDQFGGYTGMTPADFRDNMLRIAASHGLPADRLILGGDHLGPNRWQNLPAEEAMALAEDLVRAYAEAGYGKIHLDCSMACADDKQPLSDEVCAMRAARLAAVAEAAVAGRDYKPVYVIGTEVPVPGGAHETLGELTATSPEAARATVDAHRVAFEKAGVSDIWDRVVALVVQPGVEFDHLQAIPYDRSKTRALRHVLDDEPGMLFEAHSTDYQTPEALRELVEDNWFIPKVGPGLTFALREGLFALAHIEDELIPAEQRSNVRQVVEDTMVAEPAKWLGYYEGSEDEQRIARRYSFSDRLRYYLPEESIAQSIDKLLDNLSSIEIPLPLLSQYLPEQYHRVVAGKLANDPRELAKDKVREALEPYAYACIPGKELDR